MTLPNSVKLTTYPLVVVPQVRKSKLKESMQDLYEGSFKVQIRDSKLLSSTLRDRILVGRYANLEVGMGLPAPYPGTMQEMLHLGRDTVNQVIDNLDYNGNMPYLKVIDQLAMGKTFAEVTIDSRNEEYGSTCVGMSHEIVKNLKDKHGIEGVLAFQRQGPTQPLEHATVVVECSDGFVLFDPRPDPKGRIFPIPFGERRHYPGFSITASYRGSTTPLILKDSMRDLEHCTNVSNGDDLVMKHFMMEAPFLPGHEYFPIATYILDGSDRKFIGVSLKDSSIFLKDRQAPKGTRAENIPFASIRHHPEEFRKKLDAFMKPNAELAFAGFHIPTEIVFNVSFG